ncbi:MAG: hypothetical protein QF371_08945, partial [Flavobacteriales bacterium]|nr:hypothetical protein [Flavobacteriales bacterium]
QEKSEVLTSIGYSGYKKKEAEKPKKKRKRTAVVIEPVEEKLDPTLRSTPKDTATGDGSIDIYNYRFDVTSEGYKEKKQKTEKPVLSLNGKPKTRREKKREKVMARIDSLHAALEAIQDLGIEMVLPPQRNYDVAFKSEYVVTQLDNAFVNSTYQRFTGGGSFNNPGLNGFFKTGITDILDDYKVVGGFRVTGNLGTNEFFVSAQNFKRRLDKQLVFHRQTFEDLVTEFTLAKVYTHTLTYKMNWPFSDFSAVRANVLGRNDRTVYKSTSDRNLERPDEQQWTGGLKVEYVFDNTLPMGLNLYRGTRLKIFGEYYQDIDKDAKNLFVVGLDARNYIKVHRELIWANRLAASTSFGQQKLAYFMGGVDQWIAPKYNYDIPVDFDQNYAYQTLATNMRGHPQNIRNGNSFAVINSELRWPIFRYLINRPIKSNFL